MNSAIDRLPALPLIANDPYFSVCMPADTLNSAESIHWSGAPKHLDGSVSVDGREFSFLGKSSRPGMQTTALRVTPTRTISVMEAGGVELTITFCSPALPDDPDILSTPVTFVDFSLRSLDGKVHQVDLHFSASADLCFDGQVMPQMLGDAFTDENLHMAFVGQAQQHVLGHSGDHITMDWGYLYLASPDMAGQDPARGVYSDRSFSISSEPQSTFLMLGYDDQLQNASTATIDFATISQMRYSSNYMALGGGFPAGQFAYDLSVSHDDQSGTCTEHLVCLRRNKGNAHTARSKL